MSLKSDIKGLSVLEPLACMIMGLSYPKHFHEWEKLTETERRLLVLCSRDHGKTTFFSTIYPLFKSGHIKDFTTSIISYSEDQAKKIIGGIRDVIDGKPMLKGLKPDNTNDAWSKDELVLSNKSRIKAFSFGSAIRGTHSDLVIVDDPVKDFGGMTADDQERFFLNAIVPTVKPDGQLIVVGTGVYDGDLIDRLGRNKAYKVMNYPAINDNYPLWPDRWPLHKLEERRAEIGDFAFSREYMLQRIDPKTQFFKKDMFHFYDKIPDFFSPIMSLDPAITTGGDYTAMSVTGTTAENKTYLLEYENIRTDNIQYILDKMFFLAEKWHVNLCLIESIGFQRLLKHWIYEEMRKRNQHFGIVEIKGYTKSKEARIMALQPRIQNGSLQFKTDQLDVLEQFYVFPRGNHDDLLDSLAMQLPYWDKPPAPVKHDESYSWAWWTKQNHREGTYRDHLFSDLQQPDEGSGMTLLS